MGMQKPMEDPDNHIYEYVEIEDLADCQPKKLTGTVELGKWSEPDGCPPLKFCAPQYRRPRLPTSARKGIERVIPYDYDEEHNLSRDLLELVREPEFMEIGTEAAERAVKEADVITSWEGLRCLVGFADNSLQTSMETWGMNFRRLHAAREFDLFRIGRLKGYPQGPVVLGSIWHYDHNPTQRTTKRDLWRKKEGWARICTDSECSKHEPEDILHYRLLSYRLGDLKLVTKVHVRATVPLDDDSFDCPSQGVFFQVAAEIDEHKIWNADLRARYAEMKFADAAMYARAIYRGKVYKKCQELTTWDFALDRLDVPYEADIIFGRVERLLQIFIETANTPAIAHRPMWVQYWDRTLRVMSPKFFHEEEDDKALRRLYESRVAKALPMPEPLRV